MQGLTENEVAGLLQETSRTFALAVPLLAEPTRFEVGLAYLLFRCADTLEDAATWSFEERRTALDAFARMLDDGADAGVVKDWLAREVTNHAGYRHLLGLTPELLAELDRQPNASILRHHTRRTTVGMRDMVEPAAKGLQSLEELRGYCYIVAGIVGELLTDLFVADAPQLAKVRAELEAEQRRFGEGLQLVNILKDERDDRAEGRSFLPPGVSRAEVLALAADDLRGARRYIAALERGGAPPSFLAFTSLPCELAEATLELLRTDGPGAKVPRAKVVAMFQRYQELAQTP